MATKYGPLGQLSPAAGVLSNCYVVPALKHATARLIACNRGVTTTINIAHSPAGASIAPEHYLVVGRTLLAGDTVGSKPITLGAGDIIRVLSSSGDVSFSVDGIEADD